MNLRTDFDGFSELSEFSHHLTAIGGKVAKCACVKSRRSRSARACILCFERRFVRDFVRATCSAEGELGYQQVGARMPSFFDSVGWYSILTDDIDSSLFLWQQRFMSIMEECIPHTTVTSDRMYRYV